MKIRCFLLIFCLASAAQAADIAFRQDRLSIQTAGKTYPFAIEIAETPAQQELGLMRRTALERDHGMLFTLDGNLRIGMWMKDTLIPLDMLFMDDHGTIVQIAPNAVPESTAIIRARQPVHAVLELAGGTAALDNIQVGDRVIHSYFAP